MGFPNLGNMGEMIKMAREMQGQLKKIKDDLARSIYDAEAGGVRVTVSGDMEVKEVKIGPQVVNPNSVEQLNRLVKEALNKALKLAKDDASRKMKGITGGLGLPGMF
jgi:DNA-binding YbaB/EbfC family protein